MGHDMGTTCLVAPKILLVVCYCRCVAAMLNVRTLAHTMSVSEADTLKHGPFRDL